MIKSTPVCAPSSTTHPPPPLLLSGPLPVPAGDSCQFGYHQTCHDGPLQFCVPSPSDVWFCKFCRGKKDERKRYQSLRESPARPWSCDYNDTVQLLDDDELSTTPEYKAWVSSWLRSNPDFYIIWRFLDKFGEYVGIDPPPFSFKEVELLFSDPTYYAPVATVHIALLKCLRISGKVTSVTTDNWRKILQRLLSDDRSGAFNDVRKLVKVKAAQESAAQAALAAASSSGRDEGSASISKSGARRLVSESSKAAAALADEEEDDEVQQDEDEDGEDETESFFDYCAQPLCVRVLLLSTLCQEVLCCQEPSNKRLADFLRIEFEGDANASKKGKPKKAAASEAIELDDDGGEAALPPAQDKELPPALGLESIRALSEPVGAKPLFEDLILSTPAARAPPAPAYVANLHDEVLALAKERVAAVQPQTASGLRAAIAPRALRSVYYLPTCIASSASLDSGAASSAALDTALVAIPFALPKVLSKAKARVEAKERADAKAAKAAAAAATKAGLDVISQPEVTAPVAIHPADPSLPMALDPRSFFFYVWIDRDDVPRLIRSRSSMPFESVPKQPEFRQFLVNNARASLENDVAAAILETCAKEAEDNEKAAAIAAKVARLEALAVSAGGQYQGSASGTLKRTRDAWAPIAGVAAVPQAAKKKALQPVVGQRSIMGFFTSVKSSPAPEVSTAATAPAAPASEVGPASDSVPAVAVASSNEGLSASKPLSLPASSADAVADADAAVIPAVSIVAQPAASTVDAAIEADVILLTTSGDDLEDVTPMPHMTAALQSPGRSRPQREAAKKAFSPPPPPPPTAKPVVVAPEPDPENLWISVPRGATGESFATLAVGLEDLETFTLGLRFSTSPFDAALADSLEMNVLPDLRERALRRRPKRALATAASEGGGRAQAIALRDAREAPPAVPAVRSSRIASKGKASKYVEPDEDDIFDDEE